MVNGRLGQLQFQKGNKYKRETNTKEGKRVELDGAHWTRPPHTRYQIPETRKRD